MIRSIWFDGGGVIVEAYRNRAVQELLVKKYSLPPKELALVWERLFLKNAVGDITMEEFWTQLFRKFDIKADIAEGIQMYRSVITPVPGTLSILAALQGKYQLILANNEGKGFDDIRNEQIGHFQYFDKRYSSWITGTLKPHPEFFQFILDAINIPPWECLFIDDVEENIYEAERFGIRGILFKDAVQLKHDLKRVGIDV